MSGSRIAMPTVLFVCVHNAGRSQMAAALLRRAGRGRLVVHSAGSAPASEINPVVATAMGELGISLDDAFPKPLTDDVARAADIVVTMGCGDACPVYPGKHYEDWAFDDPSGRTLDEVRMIRDAIDARVREFADRLLGAQDQRTRPGG